MKPNISVIICTHNPREDYLFRALEALRFQALPKDAWDLLIVDNKSTKPISLDLGWHPSARVLREEELGLTQARLRGIVEAKGELLVFVDDDNLLDANYLIEALQIAQKHPNLGVWSGQVLPEFEIEPPEEILPFISVLCIRTIEEEIWGNARNAANLPFGAGMCLRTNVAHAYASELRSGSERALLGRRGKLLTSSEDLDIALTSIDIGMGIGIFPSLCLKHLIGSKRLSREYILKLIEDSAYGQVIFERARGIFSSSPVSRIDRMVSAYKLWRATPMQKAVAAARVRGIQRAKQVGFTP
jgi:glycosyltransferase involved in cell wall biosynthesis